MTKSVRRLSAVFRARIGCPRPLSGDVRVCARVSDHSSVRRSVPLGAGAFVIGLYGTLGNVLQALYPYPGGALSDRIGSRYALTAFGVLSTIEFAFWLFAPVLGTLSFGGVRLPAWVWVFVGLIFVLAWKSLGLGATFAIVRQSVPPERLATGFASTETFRRSGFFLGLLVAAGLFALTADFLSGFQTVLVLAVVIGTLATLAQHFRYDASEDTNTPNFALDGNILLASGICGFVDGPTSDRQYNATEDCHTISICDGNSYPRNC